MGEIHPSEMATRSREGSIDGRNVFDSPISPMPEVEFQSTNRSKLSGKAWGRVPKFLLCKTRFPRSIYFIVGNEFCERFSYYGMKAILFMYFTRELKLGNDTGTAAFHAFSMLCYFTPLFGAMIADGWIGKYRTILYISVIYALGNLTVSMTALPPLGMGEIPGPMIGLLLIAIGTGGIKPCVSAFGGDQFTSDQEHLLQSFFSVFYFAINAGSLLSMLLTPVLRGDVQCYGDDCYALAFGVPALLMLLAIALFWGGRHGYKRRPPSGNIVWQVAKASWHALKRKMANKEDGAKKSHWMDWADDQYEIQLIDDIKAMYRVLFMFLPLPVFWALFDQQGSRWVQQAGQMDGDIGVLGTIKPDQMQALNAVFIILLIPVFEGIIYPLVKKPLPLKRMCAGMALGALAFAIAGLVQLKIQDAEVVRTPPPSGYADIQFVNTLDCHVIASIQNHSVSVGALEESATIRVSSQNNTTLNVTSTCKTNLQRIFKLHLKEKRIFDFLIGYHDNRVTGHLVTQNTSLPPPGSSTICAVSVASGSGFYTVKLSGKVEIENVTAFEQPKCVTVPSRRYILVFKDENTDTETSANVILGNGGVHMAVLKDTGRNGTTDIQVYQDIEPNSVSMLWQIPQYFVITSGEILFSITGIEFAYSQAPASMKSCLQAAWLITVGIGNLIVVIEAESHLIDQLSTEFFFFSAMLGLVMVVFLVMSLFYQYVQKTIHDNVPLERDSVGILTQDELNSM